MDPVFTIPYPEYTVASQLSRHLPSSQGYAIFVPASRQQKGVDLLVTHRKKAVTRAMSIQVKASRTYSRRSPSIRTRKLFSYYTWFKTFDAPPEADFIFLVALYPNEKRGRALQSWWSQVVMVFSHKEMARFLGTVRTRGGKPDKMFGFGFDAPSRIEQTRGDQGQRYRDYTTHLLQNRVTELKKFLVGEAPRVGAV